MHMQNPKVILQIEEMPISEWHIPKLVMHAGEWCHLENLEDGLIIDMLNMLLLKGEPKAVFKYFDESPVELSLKTKLAVRQKISFWPSDHEEIMTEAFLTLKRKLIETRNNEKEFTTRLFLDHLMIGDALPSKYKRLFVSLFMNSPQLLIIDRALDLFEEEDLEKILQVIVRYSNKTGMAILNFTSSKSLTNLMRARRFAQSENQLIELMAD